jgi:hypothetical protein
MTLKTLEGAEACLKPTRPKFRPNTLTLFCQPTDGSDSKAVTLAMVAAWRSRASDDKEPIFLKPLWAAYTVSRHC